MSSVVKRFWYTVPVACLVAACGSSPSSPSGAATVVAPRQLLPAANATVRFIDQPVILTVQNAVVTKAGSGTTYTFEVATDPGFASKVQTVDKVAEGTGGQTSVKLDPLKANTDYYWHVRAQGGGTSGVFGSTSKFTVGAPITIGQPVPIAPLSGAQTYARPLFRVTNVTTQGPAGSISYKFEISAASTFTPLLVGGTVPSGSGETDFAPPTDLPQTGTLYWRVTAIDTGNNVSSTPSAPQSFTATKPTQAGAVAAKLGVTLWPGAQPPGANGHALMGSDWNVEPITSPIDGHVFMNPPLEEVQIFDLLDRGFDPNAAIDWMKSNGYTTTAAFYPDVSVIGFPYEYIAFVNGQWDIVIRIGG
jgi:hypothetical protein